MPPSWPSSGALVAGLSVQSLDDQIEFAERNHIPYPVIADPERKLGAALRLPTFEVEGVTLYKRITLVVGGVRSGEGLLPGVPAGPERRRGRRLAALPRLKVPPTDARNPMTGTAKQGGTF